MINNIDKIKNLLTFDSSDDFYHLQIIKRKKEHPELGSNSYIVKTYYISSIEMLEFYYPEIICLSDFHNARAGINLNKRSFENIAFNTLKKVTDQIMNKDYKSVRKSYNSVCGIHSATKSDKKWIIDIDVIEYSEVQSVINTIPSDVYIDTLPTKNGYHVITKPFNLSLYKLDWDIHKNNPTILYIP
jgi:hypothetical protein